MIVASHSCYSRCDDFASGRRHRLLLITGCICSKHQKCWPIQINRVEMSEEEKTPKEEQGTGAACDQEHAHTTEEAETNDTESDDQLGGINQRRSRWETSLEAFKLVQSVAGDEGVRVRDSDKVTSIALVIATICLLLSPWINPLGKIRTNLLFLCDVLAGAVLIFYIMNRFGIINTLSRRQALLTWQLILAGLYLGAYLTINLAVIIGFVISNTFVQLKP
jgi:hypothetical protein